VGGVVGGVGGLGVGGGGWGGVRGVGGGVVGGGVEMTIRGDRGCGQKKCRLGEDAAGHGEKGWGCAVEWVGRKEIRAK